MLAAHKQAVESRLLRSVNKMTPNERVGVDCLFVTPFAVHFVHRKSCAKRTAATQHGVRRLMSAEPSFGKTGDQLLKAGDLWRQGDLSSAKELLTALANNKYGPGIITLADFYMNEEENFEKAYALYRDECHRSGDVDAKLGAARLLYHGTGVTRNHDKVLELCDSTSDDPHPLLEQLAGRVLRSRGQFDLAEERLRYSYELGNWYTLRYLGWCKVENGKWITGSFTLIKGFCLVLFASIFNREERITLV